MKKSFTRLFMLVLLTMMSGWASADNVTFNTRSWDDKNKKVVTTQETKDCYVYQGYHANEWVGLTEGYYVVRGEVSYKVLNIMSGTVHLVLEDGATLKCKHIKLETGRTLHIHSQSDGDKRGKIELRNDDFGSVAGIGGGKKANMGSLYVHGGYVKASCYGYGAAGIGGGFKGEISMSHEVVIYAGKVEAEGGGNSAGIGGCKANQGGPIIIYGGDVVAKGNGGAGIGGGTWDTGSVKGNGGLVKIYGGTVVATGQNGTGAGIGGGFQGRAGEVHIYGGDVKAYGGQSAAGIGGSYKYGGGSCEITGGTVLAKGGTYSKDSYSAPAIGGGYEGPGSNVTIKGGKVTVMKWKTGRGTSALIGGGKGENDGTLSIDAGLKVSYSQDPNAYDVAPTSLTLQEDASKRNSILMPPDYTYAVIEPCDHRGTQLTYAYIDDEKHSYTCKACGYKREEAHKHDGTTDCVCGKKYKAPEVPVVPVEYWTVTIHKTTDGKTYTTEEQKVVKGKEYMLPVPQPMDGIIFMGYLQDTSVDGIEMKDSEISSLRDGGEVVTPNNDLTYWARYRYDYTAEWTWDDSRETATVKISNAILNDTRTLNATITEDTEAKVEPTEKSLGELHYNATATYNRGTGITYQFTDQAALTFFYETNPKLLLDAIDGEENTSKLAASQDLKADVTIANMTIRKDGKIHPISLPFDISTSAEGPLKGATVYEVWVPQLLGDKYDYSFKTVNFLQAGKPYFYRFNGGGEDIDTPEFKDVIISEFFGLAMPQSSSNPGDESVELWSTFETFAIDETESEQYFTMDGDGITVAPEVINAFSCYFMIPSLYDQDGNRKVRNVSLYFESGDDFTFKKKLAYSWDGNGTEANPYIIKNAEQLNEMQEALNGSDAARLQGKFFRQNANITFDKTVTNNYTPVKTFKAHYDGDGYVISGLNISLTDYQNASLFGTLDESASIKNVIIQNSSLKGYSAAAIARTVLGGAHVENCHVLKDVTIESETSAGGVVAAVNNEASLVTGCSSHATVKGIASVGGVVGMLTTGVVSNSIYLGNSITANAEYNAVVGTRQSGTIKDCYFTCPTLSDPRARLMPQYDVDNTDFLKMVNQRDKYLKTGKTDLADADISYDITLNGHTLYKDGTWNTLCLPFGVDNFSGTPLADATVKQLTKSNYWQDKNQLELNFDNVNRATGGYLYFVKWTGGDDVTSPTFSGVIIYPYSDSPHADYVDQYGTFKPVTLEADDKTVLYLGADNKLYYPKSAVTINSFHGYLKLQSNLVMGDLAAGVRSIELNFGEDTTGLEELKNGRMEEWKTSDSWYTLDGKKLQGQPTKKGVFIVNGRKVVIK